MRKLIAWWAAGGLAGAAWAALPAEVIVTAPTRLELITNGKPGGTVSLRQGETLAVVSAGDGFVVVLVNRDKSAADMAAYLRDERMPWPALAWDALRTTPEITRYAGSGIPCLVLVDAEGKVLSDSYRWGRYVGPDAVLDDTWRILRDYRRQHPRPRREQPVGPGKLHPG